MPGERNMDLHRLEVFCKVVELQSFTRAGEAIYLSQPTVSEHIRSLEETLNEKLIDRLNRKVLPTPAGRILYQYARQILRLRHEAMQAIKAYRGQIAGLLALGAGTIPGTYYLPECIGVFKRSYPALQINLKISGSRLVADDVLRGDLEAGVIGARWSDSGLEWEEIFFDELVLTVFPQHRWAGRESIVLSELEREPFILRERYSGTRKVMTDILERHGFNMNRLCVVAEMSATEAVRQSIKAEIGVSILSRQAISEDLGSGALKSVTIKGIEFFRPFYLVTPRNRELSPGCAIFLDHLRAESKILFHGVV